MQKSLLNTSEEINMFFYKWIETLFETNYKSIIEDYIESHNPQNIADIECLTREFERKHLTSWNY